jgi:hypothetical protein
LRRGVGRFKPGSYFLDLGGLLLELGRKSLCLLSELGYESLYLFLLLRNGCFQPLDFAIEHGLVLKLGTFARYRYITRHRCGALGHLCGRLTTLLVRRNDNIPAKMVGIKVQSNYNNVGAK